jgi:hypothetical protein
VATAAVFYTLSVLLFPVSLLGYVIWVGKLLARIRDPRFVTVRRGGTLQDSDHHLVAMWAADCAQHVLHLFEQTQPYDDRPRRAIEQARAWARGEITMTQARPCRKRCGQRDVRRRKGSGSRRRSSRGGGSRGSSRTGCSGLRNQGRTRGGS